MAAIYCFTSTGNSLYTARIIADRIGAEVFSTRAEAAVCEDDVIGFVFPCYFWGPPRQVARFVENMQIQNKNAYVFAVYTCGGPVFGVHAALKKQLRAKNVRLSYGSRVISVSNYLPEYKINDTEAVRRKAEEKSRKVAEAILNRKKSHIHLSTPFNKLVYKMFPDGNCDRQFSVSAECNGCGICRNVCPADNIMMTDGRPDFNHKCEHCLACLHNCPVSAIDWKDKTQGKERFRNTNISLEDLAAFNSR